MAEAARITLSEQRAELAEHDKRHTDPSRYRSECHRCREVLAHASHRVRNVEDCNRCRLFGLDPKDAA